MKSPPRAGLLSWPHLRTTLDIDDDVLALAKDLANAQRQSLGHVISDLARTALSEPTRAALERMKAEAKVAEDAPDQPE